MSRKCTICTHERVKGINDLIGKGVPYRAISFRIFGSDRSRMSVQRHSENCLTLDNHAVIKQIKADNAIDFHSELNRLFHFARKNRKAAERWLTDPSNPDQFTIAPRSSEMEVLYTVPGNDGAPVRVKENLQKILDRISGVEPDTKVEMVFVKSVDLRDFALKTIDKSDAVLDKFAKTQGLYKEKAPNTSDFQTLADEISAYIREHPEADRRQVIENFHSVATRKFRLNASIEEVSKLVN